MQIIVKNVCNRAYALQVKRDEKVETVKRKLEQKIHLPLDNYELICSHYRLKNHRTLEDYYIGHDYILTLERCAPRSSRYYCTAPGEPWVKKSFSQMRAECNDWYFTWPWKSDIMVNILSAPHGRTPRLVPVLVNPFTEPIRNIMWWAYKFAGFDQTLINYVHASAYCNDQELDQKGEQELRPLANQDTLYDYRHRLKIDSPKFCLIINWNTFIRHCTIEDSILFFVPDLTPADTALELRAKILQAAAKRMKLEVHTLPPILLQWQDIVIPDDETDPRAHWPMYKFSEMTCQTKVNLTCRDSNQCLLELFDNDVIVYLRKKRALANKTKETETETTTTTTEITTSATSLETSTTTTTTINPNNPTTSSEQHSSSSS